MPWPVTTASPQGRFFCMSNSDVRWRTYVSSSWKEPGSSSFSIRSRAVYLPLACCFSTACSEAWWIAAARSSSSWASLSSNVSGLFWRMGAADATPHAGAKRAPSRHWTFIRIGLSFPWGVEDGLGKDRHGRRAWASGVGLRCARACRRGGRRAGGDFAGRRGDRALHPRDGRRPVAAPLRPRRLGRCVLAGFHARLGTAGARARRLDGRRLRARPGRRVPAPLARVRKLVGMGDAGRHARVGSRRRDAARARLYRRGRARDRQHDRLPLVGTDRRLVGLGVARRRDVQRAVRRLLQAWLGARVRARDRWLACGGLLERERLERLVVARRRGDRGPRGHLGRRRQDRHLRQGH